MSSTHTDEDSHEFDLVEQPVEKEKSSLASVPMAAKIALAVVLVAELMNVLDHSVVLNAIPTLQQSLNAGPAAAQWLTAGYSLALAVGLITGGRLGDAYGRRRVFLIGTALFTFASLLCGIAVSPETLVAARIFQGAGAAVMLPQVLATIHVTFDGENRSRAFGLYGAILTIGSVIGPVLGGVLLHADLFGLGWRTIFLINLPIGLLVMVLGRWFITESTADKAERLDVVGMALSAIAVVLIAFPLTQGQAYGWPWWCFAMLAGGAVAATLFVVHQRTRQDDAPTVVLSTFRDKGFSAGLVAQLLFGLMSGMFFITLTLFLQRGLELTPLEASVAFVLITAGELVGVSVAVKTAGRFGRRLPQAGTVLGVAAVGVYLVLIHRLDGDLSMLAMAAPLMLFGCACGVIGGPLADLSLRDVPHTTAGSASGLFNTSIHLGMALGTALTGIVFFSVTGGSPDSAINREAFTHVLWWAGGAFIVMCGLMLMLAGPARKDED